jgi:hypothetical protein
MPSNQEIFYQAERIVKLAVADLRESIAIEMPLWDFEVTDICGRLDCAIQMIRRTNGGSG